MKRLSMFVCAAALMATGAYAGGMMTKYDANKDGKITMQEAETAHAAKFAAMDTNKDNFIDASEAQKAKKERWEKMKEHRAAKAGDKDAAGKPDGKRMHGHKGGHGMMENADTDKDGKITRAEYAAVSQGNFDDKDFNKDGVLDKSDWEAKRAACESGATLCGPLAKMDENKDGRVSKAEFMDKPRPMFERVDANKDGVIDQAEMAAAKSMKGHKKGHGMGPEAPPAQ